MRAVGNVLEHESEGRREIIASFLCLFSPDQQKKRIEGDQSCRNMNLKC